MTGLGDHSTAITAGLGRKLRLGLLMNSFDTPNWAHTLLHSIAVSDYGTIEIVVLNRATKRALPNSVTLDLATPMHQGLARKTITGVFEHLERIPYLAPGARIVRRCVSKAVQLGKRQEERDLQNFWAGLMSERPPEPDALKRIDASDLLRGISTIEVSPSMAHRFDRFDPDDIAAIEVYDLDILIDLGFRILQGEILNTARFGVWSYNCSSDSTDCANLAGGREVLEGTPCTVAALQILKENPDNNIVLARSWSATVPFSIVANRNQLYWKKRVAFTAQTQRIAPFW